MAKITRLASTLIARYYPSKTYTDAFYMDGRLFGKREVRNADITIDKEEKGFFFSVFSHPTIPGYEPGMIPPYEPQLRGICNDVKFGKKPIDAMISGFLTTAVDITGKMKLQEQDNRAPYFSGIIVHDAEAFAVTIGSGLAFIYRNDTLYPLTDAGIPMEPIDTFGNRVGDFYNYISSKTANAMWSNITTLSVDDCIILCNKAVYDSLGQRELLRILDEADDQCDAAGTVITQAAANMPNVPMQFSISFVESITADEKKGLFGFRKKNKEEDTSNMSIKSTVDGGIIGAAAEAIASAGFVSGLDAKAAEASAATAAVSEAVSFGDADMPKSAAIPDLDTISFSNFVVPEEPGSPAKEDKVEFLDKSVDTPAVEEVSADDLMKSLFGQMNESKKEGLDIQKQAEEDAKKALEEKPVEEGPKPEDSMGKIKEGTTISPQVPDIPEDSPFVSSFNPFEANAEIKESEMETVSETDFKPETNDDMMDTKTVSSFESLFANQVQKDQGIANGGIIAAALKELKEESDAEKAVEDAAVEVKEGPAEMPVTVNEDEIVFSSGEKVETFAEEKKEDKPFDPYGVGNADDIANSKSPVFPAGDFGGFDLDTDTNENGGNPAMSDNERPINEPSFEWKEEGLPDQPLVEEIPQPEYDIGSQNVTVNPVENVSFPQPSEEVPSQAPVTEEPVSMMPDGGFVIPFENAVYAEPEAADNIASDVPDMPVYGSQSYDSPSFAVNTEQPVGEDPMAAYEVGSYAENEEMSPEPEPAPYQSFGSESFEAESYQDPQQFVNEYAASDFTATQDPYAQPQVQPETESYENGAYSEPVGYDYEAAAATTAAAAATEAAAAADGDEWINSILGIDNFDNAAPSAPQRPGSQSRPKPQQRNGSTTGNTQRRPNGPRTQSSGNGGGRNGGNRPFRLSRNGAIFLIFVGILFISIIVLIGIGIHSCTSKKTKETTSTDTTNQSEQVVETTPAPTPEVDPTAPIGVFVFSDNTGYRTWWDLFNKVYGVQIEGDGDRRIEILREYNGAAPDYMPVSGAKIILPPPDVINGVVPLPGAATTPDTGETAADAEIQGEVEVGGN